MEILLHDNISAFNNIFQRIKLIKHIMIGNPLKNIHIYGNSFNNNIPFNNIDITDSY
jgi:hypothetical protein